MSHGRRSRTRSRSHSGDKHRDRGGRGGDRGGSDRGCFNCGKVMLNKKNLL